MRSWIRPAVLILLVQACALAAPQTQPALEAPDLPRPEKAIVFDLHAPFHFTIYGDVNTMVDRMSAYERIGNGIRMTAGDPQAIRVWHYNPRLPISVSHYPIMVLRYRAIRQGGPWYNLWIGWRSPDNQGTTAAVLAEHTKLIDDGQEHELRMDVRDVFKAAAITTILIGVHSKTDAPGVLEYLDLRFEAAEGWPVELPADDPPIEVEVVDEEGQPVAGAVVIVDAERKNFARRGVTDANGKATVTPRANEAVKHMVRVVAEGYLPWNSPSLDPGLGTQVRLKPAATFRGRVEGDEGKPLAGATVTVLDSDGGQSAVTTDDQGRFELVNLPLSVQVRQLEARHPDHLPLMEQVVENTPRMVELRQGRAVITMSPGVTVTGRVLNAAGEPTKSVYYVTAGEGEPRAGLDKEARFKLRGLTPGKHYTITATTGKTPKGSADVVAEAGASVEIRAEE